MYYLTADFGSTYTKLTAIDGVNAEILATASSFTTIEVDVMDGFNSAYEVLCENLGMVDGFKYDELLCCSSAAGGLKMVAIGLVPDLTAKAAKMAASSAGAKVVKTYSYEISKSECQEIERISPDLVLLCGGTDGGNKEVIINNAKSLCGVAGNFSIVVAGNKSASDEVKEILSSSGKDFVITKNVMPEFEQLNIQPARRAIMDLFISKIVDAKGLSQLHRMTKYNIIPTPFAVLNACELLSKGIKGEGGLGEFMAVDVGGATTDVYSMAKGEPTFDNVILKGLPEPYSKRTVEGDLGMRYSLLSLIDEVEDFDYACTLAGVDCGVARKWVESCLSDPSLVPDPAGDEKLVDELIAGLAVKIAGKRHAGKVKHSYTHCGEVFVLNGKDLTSVPVLIGVGGVIINSSNPAKVLSNMQFNPNEYEYLLPKAPAYMLDKRYILSSMGLLSMVDPALSLEIMKKEIKLIRQEGLNEVN